MADLSTVPFYLTTLATLKAEMNITVTTYDTLLTNYIARTSDAFARSCNRQFYYVIQVTDAVAGYATTWLKVLHTPIDVTQPINVIFDASIFDSNTYFVSDAAAGLLYNKTGWYWTAPLAPNIQQDGLAGMENPLYNITYSGGWVTPQQVIDNPLDPILSIRTLPYDLEEACIMQCVYLYRHRGQDMSIESERLLSYNVKYLPKIEYVDEVLARYRRMAMST